MFRKKIVVLGTGGTIAGTAPDGFGPLAYTAAQKTVQELLAGVPEALATGWHLEAEQVAQIDSKDMAHAVWQRLLQRCRHWLAQDNVAGLLLTHGTDTLEETAFFLQAVLAPAKPVVLTGAMRPASAPDADGPQNLKDALTLAAAPDASGVLVVFAGQIHGAREVQKVHPTRLDPFSSGDAGVLGQIQNGQLRLTGPLPQTTAALPVDAIEKIANWTQPWPRVEIVLSHAGAGGALVDALLAPCADPLRGLVVAATGNGTLHQALEAALLRAQAAGVRVVRATRCCMGTVIPVGHPAWPDSGGLSPVKARVALMLELMSQH